MAVTTLSQALYDAWIALRPGYHAATDGVPATFREGLVSDLVVGDYLVGPRAKVTALGSSGTTRSVTMQRRDETPWTVAYVSASTIRFGR
jgi:hypothetical protein